MYQILFRESEGKRQAGNMIQMRGQY